MTNLIKNIDSGDGAAEYGLLLFFVALVAVLMLLALGPVIGNVFSQIIQGLQ